MLRDLVAQVLELVLGQRADELLCLAPDRLVREGEPDTEGKRINVGHGDLRCRCPFQTRAIQHAAARGSSRP
jgi:hypothetical protein